MDRKPNTFTAAFQSVFTTRVLLMIVGVLLARSPVG
jgi:hypothetical protein